MVYSCRFHDFRTRNFDANHVVLNTEKCWECVYNTFVGLYWYSQTFQLKLEYDYVLLYQNITNKKDLEKHFLW
jgi:hypothetical protein